MTIWEKKFYGEGTKATRMPPQPELAKFVKLLKAIKARRVLDLGCGMGRNLLPLAKESFELYGIDIAPTALKVAKQRLKEVRCRANVQLGDIYQKLPYGDNFFDGVISIKVLHHAKVLQIRKLIKEIERIIKPDGILMIEVPKKGKDLTKYSEPIEKGTYVRLNGSEEGITHHIFADQKEIKTLFSNFEFLDIHSSRVDKLQNFSPHYTMFASFKN